MFLITNFDCKRKAKPPLYNNYVVAKKLLILSSTVYCVIKIQAHIFDLKMDIYGINHWRTADGLFCLITRIARYCSCWRLRLSIGRSEGSVVQGLRIVVLFPPPIFSMVSKQVVFNPPEFTTGVKM